MNKVTHFDKWVKLCEENNSILFRLEGSRGNGLYKVTREFEYDNRVHYSSPVYIIWCNFDTWTATTSLFEAYHIWDKYRQSESA